jgi:hypothetical protein
MESEIVERHYIKADPGWYVATYCPAETDSNERVELDPIVAWEITYEDAPRAGTRRCVLPITVERSDYECVRVPQAIKAPDGRYSVQEEATYANHSEWIDAARAQWERIEALDERRTVSSVSP